jgi:hypothetical protein
MTAVPPRARRRAWPWIVAVVVVLALIVAAWFLGEWIARDTITKTIRQQAITQLALPADQQIDVEIDSPSVLLDLAAGSLRQVTVSSDDVPIGPTEGDVSVTIQDVPVRGGAAGAGTGTISLTQEQLRAIMANVDGFPADSLGLAAPDLTMTTDLSLFGASVPIGVALTPSAKDGDLVLHPASLKLAGADISADDLRDRFGSVADSVLKDWDVCVRSYLPQGIRLSGVEVSGQRAVADFDIDGGIVSDPALRAKGTCA